MRMVRQIRSFIKRGICKTLWWCKVPVHKMSDNILQKAYKDAIERPEALYVTLGGQDGEEMPESDSDDSIFSVDHTEAAGTSLQEFHVPGFGPRHLSDEELVEIQRTMLPTMVSGKVNGLGGESTRWQKCDLINRHICHVFCRLPSTAARASSTFWHSSCSTCTLSSPKGKHSTPNW